MPKSWLSSVGEMGLLRVALYPECMATFRRNHWRLMSGICNHTIAYRGKTLQILDNERYPILAGKRVDVRVSPEGDIKVYIGKQSLMLKEIEAKPAASSQENNKVKAKSKYRVPNNRWLYGFKVA